MKINLHYKELEESYLFSTIAHKVSAFQKEHPETRLIRLGIGDVTRPLCSAVTETFAQAAYEQGRAETFHGYGPEQGYEFLREAIAAYLPGMVAADDIFIGDGAKSDLGNILDLFDADNTVLIPDPVYPVYVDTNRMAGRRIVFLSANRANEFLPMPEEVPPSQAVDLIYLCSPNNPTGAVYSREQLKAWVNYANEQNAIILFDAAYEAFIQDGDLTRSIFEVPGARDCAIEFGSLSKTAGFTGTRCGYTIVPKELERCGMNLHSMWLRRQTTKFNGVSYPVQRAAAAVFSEEGLRGCCENLVVYQKNARLIADTLSELGIWYTGGKNSPYIWMACPEGMTSWEFFDVLLEKAGIVGTPGSGFGPGGEGFFRLTAFGSAEDTETAMQRLMVAWKASGWKEG